MEVHGLTLTGLLGNPMTILEMKILLKSTSKQLGCGMTMQMRSQEEELFVSISQKIFKMGTVMKTAAQDLFLNMPKMIWQK